MSADGVVAGEAAKEYVLSQDIELDTVVRHRLVHLINTVYNTTWSCMCYLFFLAFLFSIDPSWDCLLGMVISFFNNLVIPHNYRTTL